MKRWRGRIVSFALELREKEGEISVMHPQAPWEKFLIGLKLETKPVSVRE